MMPQTSLPLILAGPILRHCDADNFTLFLVTSEPLNQLSLVLDSDNWHQKHTLTKEQVHCIPLGGRAYQYLIHIYQPKLLPQDTLISYRLEDELKGDLFSRLNNIGYGQADKPNFCVKSKVDQLLHGSCRNAHHHSGDALVAADTALAKSNTLEDRAALLMLTGDQVYVDDIAAPMLYAIGQVIQILELPNESFEGAPIANTSEIGYTSSDFYTRHNALLPSTEYPAKTPIWRWYINHPIFTSSLAENHLISLSEIMALYLLTWSPELWDHIDIPQTLSGLNPAKQQRWQQEWTHLLEFKAGLTQVRRLFAHMPTYMIFDDHDVTDDWNLTAKWETAAYEHAFSKRIIGNALIGYTLFQGLGNKPHKFASEIRPLLDTCMAQMSQQAPKQLDPNLQDELIQALLKFEGWHYNLNTQPKIVVLDTRTRRWRSEANLAKPSGLMDWEALMDLQQELINQDKIIIVSPAPMFGVKVIEAVQRTMTTLGASLLVDAENWMAHPGAANALLSIFMHRKTPQEFVILSGDVHYSFAYDINIRFRNASPNIYQICCSGIKNQFPEKLLPIFDRLNGWLYGHFSPLNLLTKRKRMLIRGRRPNGMRSQRLMNKSGIGKVKFADNGAPSEISVLHSDMSETYFEPPRKRYNE